MVSMTLTVLGGDDDVVGDEDVGGVDDDGAGSGFAFGLIGLKDKFT